MRITVTTASDAANGDTSSVGGLISNPGTDGISLREAILATNSDPGRYAIIFARALDGADIRVGSATGLDLPTLVGGGVWIEGDITGDGRPDVTLQGFHPPSYCMQAEFLCPGFRVSSSGIRLQTLALRGFAIGVLFTPSPVSDPFLDDPPFETHRTYANNVVSGLVMSDISRAGIAMNWGNSECDISTGKRVWACETHNSWTDTRFVGNTIESRGKGVHFPLSNSIGDSLERLMVTDNTIRIARSPLERIGIHLAAGGGGGSVRNRVSGVLIARNTIIGLLDRGVRLESGGLVSDENVIQGVRIVENDVRSSCCFGFGINIFLGEGSELVGWDLDPIQYGDRNLVRDVLVSGNTVLGKMNIGVSVETGCCGAKGNRVEGLIIEGNTIRLTGQVAVGGVHINAGSCCVSNKERFTKGNRVSDVSIDANRITIPIGRGDWAENGGIALVPGTGPSRSGEIRNVRVTGNEIDTPQLTAINLYGGAWWRQTSDVDGVAVGDALAGNRLACIMLRDNVVGGAHDELSVIVSAAHPEWLSPAARDAAWKECSWSPDQFEVAAAEGTEASPREESQTPAGDVPWPLIMLGIAGASAGAYLVIRRRHA